MSNSAPPGPSLSIAWLSIVGIGEDGIAGLCPAACAAIGDAQLVFGGVRHLALAASLIRGEARPWPSPFDVGAVVAARGRGVCVLASGDPFHYGVGATLARHLPAVEMAVWPAPSAFSLAAARLGWPIQDCVLLSLHGRALERLRPHLHPHTRILSLTSDGTAPALIASLLAGDGFGASRLSVLEALGGPGERIRWARADAFDLGEVGPVNTVAIEVQADPGARILPRAAGLEDDLFETDGQITKREVRALTLSALAPRRGELLWDIGAGSGSVAIEWMLCDPSLKAIAIEARPDRAERIGRNAGRLGVPDLRVVAGAAPQALEGLPAPDAIFVGGGGGVDDAIASLTPGGRLVANAVTLETEALLMARHAALGGRLLRIALSRALPLAGRTGWRPARPVVQWSWRKP